MSHEADGQCDIYDETTYTARKEHLCDACQEPILPGHKYVRLFTLYEGCKSTIKRCARCQAIHLHLRSKCRSDEYRYDNLWPDDRLDCGEDYKNVWEHEPPDDIAALAFALPGEVKL